ncbi:hypothetical protein AMJ57_00450 [Parcubacteria bacterium SG8_24]|nr:MAG: hypothetical protein AMJ57_00450 [Parcubacteria bacterium SG8_24]
MSTYPNEEQMKSAAGDGERYVSTHQHLCQGARDNDRYFIAVNVASAKTVRRFSHAGSDLLDRINAFDLAEVSRMNLGRINMIGVSSFCGPHGLLWGYDVVRPTSLDAVSPLFTLPDMAESEVPVYNAEPLIEAAAGLFGTIEDRRFPLSPGTLCPVAAKYITSAEPGTIYAACGLGIGTSEGSRMTVLMEDTGTFTPDMAAEPLGTKNQILRALAGSVLAVASTQGVECKKVFVALTSIEVGEGEVGCCLSMIPYFALARDALPPGGFPELFRLRLEAWL